MRRKTTSVRLLTVVLVTASFIAPSDEPVDAKAASRGDSAAFIWLNILLEASARDVEMVGARPTILSRQMALPLTAMFDAWAAYDDTAVGTIHGGALRRPPAERTVANKETAIAYAAYRVMLDQLPRHREYITAEMRLMGFEPNDTNTNISLPSGIGNTVAAALLDYRRHDGANQYGDEPGCNGEAYSDYTMYRPVNPVDKIIDPDRWQPLPFADEDGGFFYPGFLTPHWYRVEPFALASAEVYRAPPPPLAGTDQMKTEVDECIALNANLTVEEKAIIEFMRDGPRSTGQSGHWLRFAQAVSARDGFDLDQDIKLFFTVGNVAMDAFIASWDSKRYYDSSRPWTLIRHYYGEQEIRGWAGPGKGVITLPASSWHPYSPATFVTPPFPGYVSGHSTVSSACANVLRLFTGSDRFDITEHRKAGELTEQHFSCKQMQQVDGEAPKKLTRKELSCEVDLPMTTFTAAAELAGRSRVLGGYHIQSDNIEGLRMGKRVAEGTWPVYQSYFDGTAKSRMMTAAATGGRGDS